MPDTLMDAVLALDVYNRYTNPGLAVSFNKIGTYTFRNIALPQGSEDISFVGSVYTADNGSTVISYRGTDNWNLDLEGDPINGFFIAIGVPFGAQFFAAFELYQAAVTASQSVSVGGVTIDPASISFTGHSLGGGLAGVVAAIYGKQASLFANMPFELAVTNAYQAMLDAEPSSEGYADEARALIYGGSQPWQPSLGGLHAYAVNFEAIEFYLGRSQSTPEVPLDPGTIDLFKLTPTERHSMALHTVLVWEKENHAAVDGWQEIAAHLWDSFNSNAIAAEVGFDTLAGVSTPGDKMAMGIAYSVVSEGARPFGDTGVRAFFDDARDLGKAVDDGSNQYMNSWVIQELSNVLVNYSGLLAKYAVLGEANNAAQNGVMTLNGQGASLSVDFQDSKWTFGGDIKVAAERAQIVNMVVGMLVPPDDLNVALQWYQQESGSSRSGTDLIGSVTFALQGGELPALDVPSGQLDLIVTVQGSNSSVRGNSDDMLLGTTGGEGLWGGGGSDIIFAGEGGDELRGDDGSDFLFGGRGEDTLYGGAGVDRLYGGADADTLYGNDDNGQGDTLVGGAGGDRIFGGKGDKVENPDAGDVLFFNGTRLEGASRSSTSESLSGTYHEEYHDLTYTYDAATRTLVVSNGQGEQLTITDFVNGEAGIKLRTVKTREPLSPNDNQKPPAGSDPLVLDLDGDGVELASSDQQRVYFDADQDGLADRVGWVRPDDGFLVRDLDGDGRITSLTEMFGTQEIDGFTVLAEHDSNDDGVVNASDTIWATLKIWQDADADGDTDLGELKSLSDFNVQSISLFAEPVNQNSSGNRVVFSGTYQLTDGSVREAAAVFLQVRQVDPTESGDADYPDAAYAIPQLAMEGLARTLRDVASSDPQLLELATELVADARNLSSVEFRGRFEAVLLRWAGVDDIDPQARGPYADARHAAFLEEAGDIPTLFRASDGLLLDGARSPELGPIVELYFDDVVTEMLFRFSSQLGVSESVAGIDENGTDTGWFAGLYNGTTNYNLQYNMIRGDAREIGYGFGVAAGQLSDQLNYLESVSPMLQGLQMRRSGFEYGYSWSAMETDYGTGLRLGGITDAALIEFAVDRLHGTERPIHLGSAGNDALYADGGAPNTFIGGSGNDLIIGGGTSDTYVYSGGDGDDVVSDVFESTSTPYGLRGVDRLLLVGIDREDVTISVSETDAQDIVLIFAGGGTITLDGQLAGSGIEEVVFANGDRATASDLAAVSLGGDAGDGPDVITGSRFDDVIDARDGDDQVNAGLGNDRITGGKGDDHLVGNGGDDTYVYTRGDGHDIIDILTNDGIGPFSSPTVDFEQLVLHGIDPSEVRVSNGPGGVGIVYTFLGAEPGSISISQQQGDLGIDEVRFDDGTVWGPADIRARLLSQGATEGNDHLVAFNTVVSSSGYLIGGHDELIGGKGDDTLEGRSGRDTYRYRLGDGNDTIIDRNDIIVRGENRLVFDDLLASDLSFTLANSDQDLLITVNRPEGGSVLVKNTGFRPLDTIRFANGSERTFYDFVAEATNAAAEAAVTQGDDTVSVIGVNIDIDLLGGDDTVASEGGFGTVRGGDGNDHITFPEYYGDPIDLLIDGGTGNDYVSATGATVIGGAGNDEIRYADTVIYRKGDGDDVVGSINGYGGARHVELVGLDPADVTFTQGDSPDDLRIVIGGDAPGSVTLLWAWNWLETIHFQGGATLVPATIAAQMIDAAGTGDDDVIVGMSSFSNTILGRGGDDDLTGGSGMDTFVYAAGDGHDIIHYAQQNPSELLADRLVLHGITAADVTVTREGADAVLTFGSPGGGSIRLVEQFGARNIVGIDFDDGSHWVSDEIARRALAFGEDGTLTGTADDEVVRGSEISETLSGGAGDDNIRSNGGNDVIIFNPGDGHDTVDNLFDLSVLQVGTTPDDVTILEVNPYGYVAIQYTLRINSTGDTIGIGAGRLPIIEFSDGTRWFAEDWNSHLTVEGTSGSDELHGTSGYHDEVFDARGGPNDVVWSNGGNDTFRYHKGDGFLTIINGDAYSPRDTDRDMLDLRGIDPADVIVTVERHFEDWGGDNVSTGSETDIVIRFRDEPGAVRIKNALDWNVFDPHVELLRFEDGTVWSAAEILDRATVRGNDVANVVVSSNAGDGFIRGGGGDDRIVNVTASDEVHWAKGDGNDRLIQILGAGTLVLEDVSPAEATFERQGKDLRVTIGLETITVVDQFGTGSEGLGAVRFSNGETVSAQQLYGMVPQIGGAGDEMLRGSRFDDVISGMEGDDSLIGSDGADTLIGGAGADYLNGGKGSDTYEWTVGDGNDTVRDKGGRYDGTDTLRLKGVSADDILLERLAVATTDFPYDTLRVTIKSTGEAIFVESQFLIDYLAGGYLEYSNGDPDDNPYGGEGGYQPPAEPLVMTDIVHAIEAIVLDDGTVLDLFDSALVTWGSVDEPPYQTVTGTAADDVLYGAEGRDAILGKGGNDVLVGGGDDDLLNGGEGDDQARYLGSSERFQIGRNPDGSVSVLDDWNEEGTDTLWGVESVYFGGDERTIDLAALPIGTAGNDVLTGSADSDLLFGLAGDDILTGGEGGYDTLDGGEGYDVVTYAGSSEGFQIDRGYDGSITVWDNQGMEGYDELRNVEALYFAGDDTTILVSSLPPMGTSGDDFITGTARSENLYGAEGDDTLVGMEGDDSLSGDDGADLLDGGRENDYLYGGTGDDLLIGGTGDDFLMFNFGDGNDLIDQQVGAGEERGADTLYFGWGITSDAVTVSQNGPDIVIAVAPGDSVTLLGAAADESLGMAMVQFYDGVVWTYADMLARAGGASLDAADTGMLADTAVYSGPAHAAAFGGYLPRKLGGVSSEDVLQFSGDFMEGRASHSVTKPLGDDVFDGWTSSLQGAATGNWALSAHGAWQEPSVADTSGWLSLGEIA